MNCKDFFVIRHSWCKNPLKVFGLHEYRPISRFEASAVKVMRPILTREFSFQLILLSLLHCDVDHGVKVGILEDESLKWHLLHVCHPGIMVQFLSFERRYSFLNLTLFLMYWRRVDAVAAAAFRKARVPPASWRQRFPDARLKIHLRLNIVRILWASCYSTVRCEYSQHRLSNFSFISRNNEP